MKLLIVRFVFEDGTHVEMTEGDDGVVIRAVQGGELTDDKRHDVADLFFSLRRLTHARALARRKAQP